MTDINAFTKRLFHDAGIAPGMRVIDIGCGSGEVTFLVANLVGERGEILGVDRDARAIETAKKRASDLRLTNVNFLQGELSEALPGLGPFDAAVGRRVLMYLPSPVDVVRAISKILRPGGILAFQESDSTMIPGRTVAMPLHDKVVRWMWTTVEREGADIHMGFNLPSVLKRAGIITDHVRAEPIIQGQGTHYPLSFIVRAMLPRMIQHGVIDGAEVDIETLEQRLAAERPSDVVYVSDMAFGVWGHTPFGEG